MTEVPMGAFLIFLALTFATLQASAKELTIYAASSLGDVLTTLVKGFEDKHKVKVLINFDASSRLARQIEEGAPADLFFSADENWNNYLEEKNIILQGQTIKILSNELVIITHEKSNFSVIDLKALTSLPFKTMALADASTPAGKYTTEAFHQLSLTSSLQKRLVTGDNVRNVLKWVALNEVDIGIVYETDALMESRVKILAPVPSKLHSKITYPLSLVGKNPSPLARELSAHLRSHEAKSVYRSFGFKTWEGP